MAKFFTFIETEVFTKRLLKMVDDETYTELQAELVEDPTKGKVIQGTGGLRKIRMAARGKGKRGGARVSKIMRKALFNELQKSMEQSLAHSQGKITLRSSQVPVPKRITALAPREILKLRKRLGTSQAVFARLLNVSTTTEIKWETGRRKPSGAALRLLDIASKRPEILYSA